MRFKKTLAGLALGTALALTPREAKSNVILKIGPVDASNNFYTNVVQGPIRLGVYLDSTGEPTKGISSIDWDVFFGSLTNYVTLDSAVLPNHNTIEDFFYGYTMDAGYNRVDGTLSATSYADDNVRKVQTGFGFPSNTTGFLGFFNCSADNLATNVRAMVANAHAYDTIGAAVGITPTNLRFNVVAIPEPGTLGLVALALGGAYAARRKIRRSMEAKHSQDTGRKNY